MNVNISGAAECTVAIAEFKRNIIMNRYELGDLTKEETLQKLRELERELEKAIETVINAFL